MSFLEYTDAEIQKLWNVNLFTRGVYLTYKNIPNCTYTELLTNCEGKEQLDESLKQLEKVGLPIYFGD